MNPKTYARQCLHGWILVFSYCNMWDLFSHIGRMLDGVHNMFWINKKTNAIFFFFGSKVSVLSAWGFLSTVGLLDSFPSLMVICFSVWREEMKDEWWMVNGGFPREGHYSSQSGPEVDSPPWDQAVWLPFLHRVIPSPGSAEVGLILRMNLRPPSRGLQREPSGPPGSESRTLNPALGKPNLVFLCIGKEVQMRLL